MGKLGERGEREEREGRARGAGSMARERAFWKESKGLISPPRPCEVTAGKCKVIMVIMIPHPAFHCLGPCIPSFHI